MAKYYCSHVDNIDEGILRNEIPDSEMTSKEVRLKSN